jgi:hypothetical protein
MSPERETSSELDQTRITGWMVWADKNKWVDRYVEGYRDRYIQGDSGGVSATYGAHF